MEKTNHESVDEFALRQELVDVARRLNRSGLNQGTSGNLSVRIANGLLITPSSMSYELMEPADLVAIDFCGQSLISADEQRRPSSEWRIHADIFVNRPEVMAVVHCHSIYATALACHGLDIPSFHYMVVMAGGSSIRCAPYATFGTQQLSESVLKALDDRTACLMAHHGQVSVGANLNQALALAVEVETLSHMYLQAQQIGEPPSLGEEEMEKVRQQMACFNYGGLNWKQPHT
jgi:L-fuculose-phosphate aldolase